MKNILILVHYVYSDGNFDGIIYFLMKIKRRKNFIKAIIIRCKMVVPFSFFPCFLFCHG